MNRTIAILLPLLLALLAPSASAGHSQWRANGFALGGGCDSVDQFGPGWHIRHEVCQFLMVTDPESFDIGPSLFQCRRDACVRGDCPRPLMIHVGQRAGPMKACAAAISGGGQYEASGWIAASESVVLRIRKIPQR
jgi:hypothetical protein